MKVAPFAVSLAAIALAGCAPKVEECWSPSTKASFVSLVRSVLLEKIAVMAKGSSSTDEERAYYDKQLTVSADLYHVIARDKDSGSLTCGANIGMSYALNNGKKATASNTPVTFHIYKAENGSVFSLENTLSIASLLAAATENAK